MALGQGTTERNLTTSTVCLRRAYRQFPFPMLIWRFMWIYLSWSYSFPTRQERWVSCRCNKSLLHKQGTEDVYIVRDMKAFTTWINTTVWKGWLGTGESFTSINNIEMYTLLWIIFFFSWERKFQKILQHSLRNKNAASCGGAWRWGKTMAFSCTHSFAVPCLRDGILRRIWCRLWSHDQPSRYHVIGMTFGIAEREYLLEERQGDAARELEHRRKKKKWQIVFYFLDVIRARSTQRYAV